MHQPSVLNTDGGRPIALLPFFLNGLAGFLPGTGKYWVKDAPHSPSAVLPAERGGQ